VNLLITNATRCIGSNAKTLGLKYLQFSDMEASGESADGAHVVHLRTDELLLQQNSIPDEEISPA